MPLVGADYSNFGQTYHSMAGMVIGLLALVFLIVSFLTDVPRDQWLRRQPPVGPADRPPEPWKPTQVRWEPNADGGSRWMSGWLDPAQEYFAVEQQAAGGPDFVSRVTREGLPDGTSVVRGESWQRYRSADQRTFSLVRPSPEVTTIVVSDSSFEALESFAATLG